MVEKMNGVLRRFYKRDESTGYSVFGIETDEIDVIRNIDGLILSEGIIPKWPIDTFLILDGRWNEHIYEVKSGKPYTETIETSKTLMKRIIGELQGELEDFRLSALGIKKILEVTGPDILSFSKEKNAKQTVTNKLPKIDPQKINLIFDKIQAMTESYHVIEYISKFGGTTANCDKLIKLYGPCALKQLKKTPYKTGYIAGMSFFECDRIAFSLNLDALNNERITSMIHEALNQLLNQSGSTYATQSVLKKQVLRVSKKSAYPNEEIPIPVLVSALQKAQGLVIEFMNNGTRIYKKFWYDCENIIASNLERLNQGRPYESFDSKYIKEVESLLNISYSQKQKDAFISLSTSGVKIITGGPGTGKTTVVNGILYMYQKMHPKNKILLCAPTGRAAQRMSEVTTMDAFTLHRALEFRPYENGVIRHKDADDKLDADLIVVDEMSMVDTEIFSILLPAIKKGSTIILIGDENQLQSVSNGNILHDLILSDKFEMYRLKEVFRQKGNPTIIDNAYKILEGKMNFVRDETFDLIECESIKDAMNEIMRTFDKLYLLGELNKSQILSPVKISDGGTGKINEIVSEKINLGKADASITYKHYKTVYHNGDKVIFLKNNYEKDYYNGDIGYIAEILKNGFVVNVGNDAKVITGDCLKDVTLAYAITIHKSQGSEADYVLIILPDTHINMLNRNLLFTAVTRAKKYVKIAYVNSALSDSVHTIIIDKRNTGLVDKLTGIKREVLI